jgi:hypothetical protein
VRSSPALASPNLDLVTDDVDLTDSEGLFMASASPDVISYSGG